MLGGNIQPAPARPFLSEAAALWQRSVRSDLITAKLLQLSEPHRRGATGLIGEGACGMRGGQRSGRKEPEFGGTPKSDYLNWTRTTRHMTSMGFLVTTALRWGGTQLWKSVAGMISYHSCIFAKFVVVNKYLLWISLIIVIIISIIIIIIIIIKEKSSFKLYFHFGNKS